MKKILIALATAAATVTATSPAMAAGDIALHFDPVNLNIRDNASLQRGAATYAEYCLGCHEAKYMRYERAADDLGVPPADFLVLMKAGEDVTPGDMMLNSLPEDQAKVWFGKVPPDLSLIARSRSDDWLYNYLRAFYRDPSKPMGTNNAVLADAGMPHVFLGLQGVQEPVFANCSLDGKGVSVDDKHLMMLEEAKQITADAEIAREKALPAAQKALDTATKSGNKDAIKEATQALKAAETLPTVYQLPGCGPKTVVDFTLVKAGTLTTDQFDAKVRDLVNFMDYMAEPQKRDRIDIGIRIMLLLLLFAVAAFMLKREYWRDVH